MVPDIDIWRSAAYLIKKRDDAELYAVLRADELLAAGHTEGNIAWTRRSEIFGSAPPSLYPVSLYVVL